MKDSRKTKKESKTKMQKAHTASPSAVGGRWQARKTSTGTSPSRWDFTSSAGSRTDDLGRGSKPVGSGGARGLTPRPGAGSTRYHTYASD